MIDQSSLPWRRAYAVALAAIMVFPACSVNVKKGDSGDEKNVDITTPVGGLHVSKEVDPRDTGMSVYPGARRKEKSDKGDDNANLGISTSLFGFKVVVVHYESDDAPEKVVAYYQNELKRYGSVLECHTRDSGGHTNVEMGKDKSHSLKCENDNEGKTIELKVGQEENQHVVAIEPQAKGCEFTLVKVQTHGSDTI
ncbi:MAG TPA: hypothetical protein VH088_05750 [Terriglobales bacterium]|jgi:hypothetical protein|nr:hypothetical protein [Terriglobales bacterium]